MGRTTYWAAPSAVPAGGFDWCPSHPGGISKLGVAGLPHCRRLRMVCATSEAVTLQAVKLGERRISDEHAVVKVWTTSPQRFRAGSRRIGAFRTHSSRRLHQL